MRMSARKPKINSIFLVGVLFMTNAGSSASLIDANFKLSRKSIKVSYNSNELGHLYRGFLARSMYSRCHWLPSDSQYLNLATAQCGPVKGAVMAISRFMTEPDVSKINSNVVDDHGRIRFVDFEMNCGSR